MTMFPSIIEHDRFAVFIDGSNFDHTIKRIGLRVDYKRLHREIFNSSGRMVRLNYYTALFADSENANDPLRRLTDWLMYNGYNLVTKPVKSWTANDGSTQIKGNMDLEIAVDMLQMADRIDHAILFSGDGDFACVLRALQAKGVVCHVVAALGAGTSQELRRQADFFVDLANPHIAATIEKMNELPSVPEPKSMPLPEKHPILQAIDAKVQTSPLAFLIPQPRKYVQPPEFENG